MERRLCTEDSVPVESGDVGEKLVKLDFLLVALLVLEGFDEDVIPLLNGQVRHGELEELVSDCVFEFFVLSLDDSEIVQGNEASDPSAVWEG